MISYRRFLFEQTFSRSKEGHYHHFADVHGHKVQVEFSPHENNKPGHYSADFYVDNNVSKDQDDRRGGGEHVLRHVAKTVHHFVREEKPKAIHMRAVDKNREIEGHKQKVYDKFAKHLSKSHRATIEHTDRDGSIVHFRHGIGMGGGRHKVSEPA